ncbi:MAG: methyltransferase [Clostridia bacterium]|nr:methyltransferase [Clostridia bacterium]
MLRTNETLDAVNEQLRLIQRKDGLRYGTDAYLLAAYVRPAASARAVDLGSGTGIIPLLCLAKNKFAHAYAVEVQEEFADIIGRNAAINEMADRLTPLYKDLRELTAADLGGQVSIVTANPPYMKTNAGKRNDSDAKYIARHEVKGGVDEFCAAAARVLKHGGSFYVVWRPDRLSELMEALARHKLEPKRMSLVQGDENAEPGMVLIEAKKGAAHGMRISPTLILTQNGTQSARAAQIYQTCSWSESDLWNI